MLSYLLIQVFIVLLKSTSSYLISQRSVHGAQGLKPFIIQTSTVFSVGSDQHHVFYISSDLSNKSTILVSSQRSNNHHLLVEGSHRLHQSWRYVTPRDDSGSIRRCLLNDLHDHQICLPIRLRLVASIVVRSSSAHRGHEVRRMTS